jgi:hypothetical protein
MKCFAAAGYGQCCVLAHEKPCWNRAAAGLGMQVRFERQMFPHAVRRKEFWRSLLLTLCRKGEHIHIVIR